jgi:L-amino acid N-acyltransferase YncA
MLAEGRNVDHSTMIAKMSTIGVAEVRPATTGDMVAVSAIFAHYVTGTVVTFETEPPTVEDWQVRLRELESAAWPFVVGTVEGEVVGYAYVSAWRAKPAYRQTVESSVYVAPARTGRGYGRALLVDLMARAAEAGARQVIAVIVDSDSAASTALHEAVGFTAAGRLREVGFKHGRWVDVVLMQASLPAASR